MSSKRHTYIRDDYSDSLNRTTDDEIRKLDREYNARIGAVVIVVSVLVAVFLSYAHATSTVSAQWVSEYTGEGAPKPAYGATAEAALAACQAFVPADQPTTVRVEGKIDHGCSAPRYVATETFSANPPPPDTDSDGVPDSTDQCPTVPASTPDGCPATPPPTTEVWTQCAVERGSCAYSGIRRVCYALRVENCSDADTANDRIRERAGPTPCTNAIFTDPQYGVVKACFLSGTTPPVEPPPPTGTGSATLTWTAPTRNVDDTPLTDLSSYLITYGASCDARSQSVSVPAPATRYVVGDLAPGSYCFAVAAVSAGGVSAPSNAATKVIP